MGTSARPVTTLPAPPPGVELPDVQPDPLGLLSTGEFVAELLTGLAGARQEIAIELMTFDGDASGLSVAAALTAAARRGVRVRLLVDCFARRFVSDQPVSRGEVADEHCRTARMFDELAAAGVAVRFTHPNGWGNVFALARNHKKLYLIDDVVYLGGVNVSDHNFAWHDVMVRIRQPLICWAVAQDFDATWAGRRRTTRWPIVTNGAVATTFDELVAGARRRLVVASPYALDRRVVAALASCPAPDRRMIVAERNNFWCLRLIAPYLADRAARAGVRVASFDRFSHAKFVLADDVLLVGSANFGRHSLTCNDEIGLVVTDPAFVELFERTVLRGLVELDTSTSRWRRLVGRVSSGLIDGYLIAYAHLIAPHVPPLATGGLDGARRRFPSSPAPVG